MPYYSVVEGEGVAGPLAAVTAETTTMLSCMAFVFRNTATTICGLYQDGALSIHQPFVQNTIIQMINDIQPTHIYLTAAPPVTAVSNNIGSTMADRNNVDLFFIQHAFMANVVLQPPEVLSCYTAGPGFLLNQTTNGGGGTRRYIEMATQRPSSNGRVIGGNTTFYGGLGPNTPAHTVTTDDIMLR